MQSSYLLVNELRLHYLRWTDDLSEQPVLLLHGLASNARIWQRVAPFLVQAGLQPVAPDLRGHGLTDKPESGYDFDSYARDLLSLINLLELERPLLVGHSWGGMLALDYAARFPVGPRAPSGIVLVDGGMTQLDDWPGATWEVVRDRLTPPRLDGMPLETFLERLNDNSRRWQPDDEAIAIILANFEVSEDEHIRPRLSFDHHMQIVRAMWEFRTYSRFQALNCPALLLPARPAAPGDARENEYLSLKQRGVERVQEQNSRVRVHWMEDSIHDVPLQRPQALAQQIISFAESLP